MHERKGRSWFRLVFLHVLAGLLISAGCSQSPRGEDGPQFAFVSNGVASFWNVAEAGCRQAEQDFGAEVTVIFPDGLTDQTRKLEDLVTRGIDGIAVSPISGDNQIDVLNQAAAATHLITHDSDAPGSQRVAYVGMDNYAAGRMCGQLVRDQLPEGGSVMLFIGRLDQDNAQYRRQGCIDAILGRQPDATRRDPPGAELVSEDGRYKVLGTLTDQFDRAKAKANAEDTLTRYSDLDAMVGLFAYNPPAILEALDRADLLGKVAVIAFDEDEVTLQAIRDGHVAGTVVQDPFRYGYDSIRILHGLHQGDDSVLAEGSFIDIPPRLITPENLDEFWDTLNEQMGKQ
ncbi:MAG: sugar-binding protein [Planctomycetota bacterium]